MLNTNKLVFHEDDYKLIELLPRENFFNIKTKISELALKSSKSFTENGYTEIYSIEAPQIPLEVKKIPKQDFSSMLKDGSNIFFDEIFKGYSSYEEKINNCEGFGYENYVILYTYNNDCILSCWVIYKKISETLNTYPVHLKNALEKIGTSWDLLLVDWTECILTDLSEAEGLNNYINVLHS